MGLYHSALGRAFYILYANTTCTKTWDKFEIPHRQIIIVGVISYALLSTTNLYGQGQSASLCNINAIIYTVRQKLSTTLKFTDMAF